MVANDWLLTNDSLQIAKLYEQLKVVLKLLDNLEERLAHVESLTIGDGK